MAQATLFCSGAMIATYIRARPPDCSETLKASGTVLGWRHPTDTMW